jgi:hypothetical protein
MFGFLAADEAALALRRALFVFFWQDARDQTVFFLEQGFGCRIFAPASFEPAGLVADFLPAFNALDLRLGESQSLFV